MLGLGEAGTQTVLFPNRVLIVAAASLDALSHAAIACPETKEPAIAATSTKFFMCFFLLESNKLNFSEAIPDELPNTNHFASQPTMQV